MWPPSYLRGWCSRTRHKRLSLALRRAQTLAEERFSRQLDIPNAWYWAPYTSLEEREFPLAPKAKKGAIRSFRLFSLDPT